MDFHAIFNQMGCSIFP